MGFKNMCKEDKMRRSLSTAQLQQRHCLGKEAEDKMARVGSGQNWQRVKPRKDHSPQLIEESGMPPASGKTLGEAALAPGGEGKQAKRGGGCGASSLFINTIILFAER